MMKFFFTDHLKGPCKEIFDLCFFYQSTPCSPIPVIHALKYFRISFQIRKDIRSQRLIMRYRYAALRIIKIWPVLNSIFKVLLFRPYAGIFTYELFFVRLFM
jgi:hypothetical protein